MLDPEQIFVEHREVMLPLGTVALSVIRSGMTEADAAESRTMELLEHSVRTQVEFIGVSFPTKHAIVIAADTPGHGGGADISLGTYFEVESIAFIAHQIAHSYTFGAQPWTEEGTASFLDSFSESAIYGTPLPSPRSSCNLADNIAELVRLEHDASTNPRTVHVTQADLYSAGCNYILGEGMFLDLYRSLGDQAFRQAFRNMHLLSRDEDRTLKQKCTGVERGLCYITAAFVTGATRENAAIAEEIINRRYYGPAP